MLILGTRPEQKNEVDVNFGSCHRPTLSIAANSELCEWTENKRKNIIVLAIILILLPHGAPNLRQGFSICSAIRVELRFTA